MSDYIDKTDQERQGNFNREPEIPEFIIERDDDARPPVEPRLPEKTGKKWFRRLLKALAMTLMVTAALFAYKAWDYYYNIGVPVSTTPAENIEKLQTEPAKASAEVVLSSDSILGVALDFYAIHGLRASIEFQEPDTADASVYLYSRSADHQADGQYLGSLVVDGEELQSDRSRLGYMAMADGLQVIGVGRSDRVKDYVADCGGSFFRQFILVSNGVIPSRFHLHGKVERRALGRIGDTLYYIATRHKETLWDFADALREYGFIDAIYITGGAAYSYYRSADGERHDIGNIADYPHKKWKGVMPWLVFRKASPQPSPKGEGARQAE